MAVRFNNETVFDVTYLPGRRANVEVEAEVSLHFDQGFGVTINNWANQYGNGFAVVARFFFVSVAVRLGKDFDTPNEDSV